MIKEVYHVQFFNLALVSGLTWAFFKVMPACHSYRSFETSLPLSWNNSITVSIRPETLSEGSPSFAETVYPEKSALICTFCSCIKAFATVYEIWGHVYHQHNDVDTKIKLKEIKRTVELWSEYWFKLKEGKHALTQVKLAQVKLDVFCWKDVVGWNLRWVCVGRLGREDQMELTMEYADH